MSGSVTGGVGPQKPPIANSIGQTAPRASGFDMETLVGYILLVGVLSSIGLLVIGTAWHWSAAGSLELNYTIEGRNLWQFLVASVRQLTSGAVRPRTVVNLGISVLLLTPLVRVLASMLYFLFVERNWKYTLFTLFVFSILSYSLLLR